MKYKILINCSNLHVGGGVAVATSFIDCLSRLSFDDTDIAVLISSAVAHNLKELGINTSVFSSYTVQDYFGLQALWGGLDKHFKSKDLVFTVFGPAYYLRRRTRHLVGFAHPLIIYPNNPISSRAGVINRISLRIKSNIQVYFFSRADIIVVELEHVKRQLEKLWPVKAIPIHVVYSAVHTVFNQPEKWGRLTLPQTDGNLRLGIISRNYPHKNLSILPEVKSFLLDIYGRNVDFYVTFPPVEWLACDRVFREKIINVGALSLSQCPTFYSSMDGIIFPSILECFSAVPIETLILKKPLFASNLSFIRDICADNCNYFEPFDPIDIARVIHEYFCFSVSEQKNRVNKAHDHVLRFPSPVARAEKYLAIIRHALIQSKA